MSAALIAFLLLAPPASPAPSPDEAAVVRAVKEYHAAFEAGDPARVLAVLGPTYFIGDEKSAGGGDRMSAHFFKVGDTLRDWPKNFLASSGPYNHHGDGRIALWCKAAPGAQEDLVAANPKHFFVPPYVGKAGWLGIRLDKGLAWGIVASLVRDGYLEIAPKKLRGMLVAKP